jgi:replicative DNA helicase
VPPCDLDAEAAVIATVLIKASEFDNVAAIVNWTMFYSDSNKFIFEAITELSLDNQPVDMISVASRLRQNGKLERVGGTPYIGDLTDKIPAVANVATYAEIVRDKWQARQLILRCQRYAAEAYMAAEPSVDIIQRAENDIEELLSEGVGSELVPLGKILADEVAERRVLRESGEVGRGTGTPTGYLKLDQMTGGLHDTDLVVAAGRPGMGKTSWCMNILANVARPLGDEFPEGAAFFSIEMPRSQVALRFACAEESIDVSSTRKNSLSEDEWNRLERAAVAFQRFPIWVDDSPALTVLDVRTRVKKLMRDIAAGRAAVPCKRLKVVAVDYLQLMKGIRRERDNRENEVASLSAGLKALAKDLKVTVIAVSQLNRNTERGGKKDRRPELSDLRESGAIEQDADIVWFLYRVAYYDRESTSDDAELIVAKDRNGPTGTVPLRFRDASTRFFERAEQSYDELSDDFAEDG